MHIYDISMTISPEMMVYKNKPEKKPVLTFTKNYPAATTCESRITMDMHTGTHVDAPLHMLPGGRTIDTLELSRVVTWCQVHDFTHVADKISAAELAQKKIAPGDFILLKTQNSFQEHFNPNFIYLDHTGAKYLQDIGISGVGIDALGIERNQPGHETHLTLFQAEILVLEGLRLKDISQGKYFLCAAPLKISGAEGAPARAILLQGDWFDRG